MIERYVSPVDPVPDTAEWRPLPMAPAYCVSEYGHLRRNGALRRPAIHPNGYFHYTVRVTRGAAAKGIPAHRAVAMAFLPPPRPGQTMVAHWDGMPMNCHRSNLRWASAAENWADRYRHGTHSSGSQNPNSKLTEDQVRIIRQNPQARAVDLAEQLGVSRPTISAIRHGHLWGHIQEDTNV